MARAWLIGNRVAEKSDSNWFQQRNRRQGKLRVRI